MHLIPAREAYGWKNPLLLGLVLLAVAAEGQAQVVAPSGRTLFNRNVMLRCTPQVDFFDEANPAENIRSFSLPCAVNWGVWPATNIVAVVPFQVESTRQAGGESRTVAGRGDALFFVQYDGFYRKTRPRGFTRVGAQFGVKTDSDSGGFGSGASAFFATGIFSHIHDRHWLISDLQYVRAGEDAKGRRKGDQWNYDFAYLYRLLPWEGFRGDNLFLVFELNGRSADRDKAASGPVPDSGGNLLFFSPGVEYLPTRRLVLELAMPVPVVRDLNGSQTKPKFSLIAGFRILF